MKIMATDQSTNITGIAVLVDGKIDHTMRIDLSKDKDVPHRIKEMFLKIADVIHMECPDKLIVEAVQQQQNPKATMMLSQLQGMLIGYAYCNGIPVESPMPVEWRKIVGFRQGPTVKRQKLKAQAIEFAYKTFNMTATEDECEAACIAYSEFLKENESV